MTTQLTATQRTMLTHAHRHTEDKLTWFPDNVKGGARQKVLDGLAKHGLIRYDGADWVVSDAGYAAIGASPEVDRSQPPTGQRTREHRKQADVIAMLRRPEGATIAQICEATGWQQHTVRGTLSGALKKKLGLLITSVKEPGGLRVYRAS